MEKVVAVVVTYNRRHLLAECLQALRQQSRRPDVILVVNNGSTDGTAKWLATQTDVVTINQFNCGSAGGFNTGIQWAFQAGCSWVWCMDDDGYPQENALEQLLLQAPVETALLNCAVINIEDKKSFVWKTAEYRTIDEAKEILVKDFGHPFNGTLIPRAIIEKAGLPKTSLFVWGDESEYFNRITRKYAFPVYTVTTSLHYHPPSAFNYRRDWDFKEQWKVYYYVRNRWQIHQSKHSKKAYAFINYLCFFIALSGAVLFFQKSDRMKKLSFICWPLYHAVINNYAVTPSVVVQRLQRKTSYNPILKMKNYYRIARQFMLPPVSPQQITNAA
ncbi:MAG: glycosyltransferase family 2 protein [Ferruginibacter sp.]